MSGAVGSTPRYTRSGFSSFADFSSLDLKSSSRMISATPFCRYENCSETGLNFGDDTIFSPELFQEGSTRVGPRFDTFLRARCARPPCKRDVPRAKSARPAFPACHYLRLARTPAARSAPHPDSHPQNVRCSLKTSRHVPELAVALPARETRAAATDEYSKSDCGTRQRIAAKATACNPPNKPVPRAFPAAPRSRVYRKLRARALLMKSRVLRRQMRAPFQSPARLPGCSARWRFQRRECDRLRHSRLVLRNSIHVRRAEHLVVSSCRPEISTVTRADKTGAHGRTGM